MTENEMRNPALFTEACQRLTSIAERLSHRMPVVDVASVFAGTAVNVLVTHLGREGAAQYLCQLAREIQADMPPMQ